MDNSVFKALFYLFLFIAFILFIVALCMFGYDTTLLIILIFLLIVSVAGAYAMYIDNKMFQIIFLVVYIVLIVLFAYFSQLYWSVVCAILAAAMCFVVLVIK